MIKKVINFNRLQKQAYQKPTIEISEADMELQILASSVTGVTTSGLDEEESLSIDAADKEKSIWDDAW